MVLFKKLFDAVNVIKTYEQRLINAENSINRLNSEVLSVATDNKTLRDKVLRKIQFKKPQQDDESDDNNAIGPFIPT